MDMAANKASTPQVHHPRDVTIDQISSSRMPPKSCYINQGEQQTVRDREQPGDPDTKGEMTGREAKG